MKHSIPVICPACGLRLEFISLAAHQEKCPALRYPHSDAASKSVLQALASAGATRRQGQP